MTPSTADEEAASILERARQVQITEALTKIVADRAVIEQAKGMLMAIYGVDEELAFKLLVWRSQQTNEQLYPLAEQLVHDFCRISDQRLRTRLMYDKLLMTLQDRLHRR